MQPITTARARCAWIGGTREVENCGAGRRGSKGAFQPFLGPVIPGHTLSPRSRIRSPGTAAAKVITGRDSPRHLRQVRAPRRTSTVPTISIGQFSRVGHREISTIIGCQFKIPMPTILVVDDDPKFLNAAEHMLTTAGYRVLRAADGNQAVDILEKKHSEMD